MASVLIYHTCRRAEWEAAKRDGVYRGSSQDRLDGYIHFSTATQLRGSVEKHRAGQADLLFLTVDAVRLGDALKWEPARRGQLFPHLHGELPLAAVLRAEPLTRGADGAHVFPAPLRPTDE